MLRARVRWFTGTGLRRIAAAAVAVAVVVPAGPAVPAAALGPVLPGGGGTASTVVGIAWGGNFRAQVGDGTTVERHVPTLLNGLFGDLYQLYGGRYHSLALRYDGRAFAWGANDYGELGDGTTTDRLSPVFVGLTGITEMAVGAFHSVALRSDGTVWAWGNNDHGELGDGTTTDHPTPVQVATLSNIVHVAANEFHSFAVRSDGSVWAWGANGLGELGDGTTITRKVPVMITGLPFITQVSAGRYHTLALALSTQVFAWGNNFYAQLGDGTTTTRLRPVELGGVARVIQVAAGLDHSIVLRENGTLLSWGANDVGQLGNGTISPLLQYLPGNVTGLTGVTRIATGAYHSLALLPDRTVRTWGGNSFGQIGDGTVNAQPTPTAVPNLTDVVYVSSGEYHSQAMTFAPLNYTLGVNPTAGTVSAGQSVSTSLSITVLSGYAPPVSLSVGSLPAGVSVSMNPPTVSPGFPSTITVSAAPTTLSGSYPVTITGSAAGVVRSTTYTVTVVGGGEFGCSSGNHAPVPIPDNGPPVTSTILLIGCDMSRAPTRVIVTMTILHPRRGDLIVDLIGPDGTAYLIKGSNPSDTAPNVVGTFVVDLTGSSSSLLAVPPGTMWRLRAQDVIAGSAGTIQEWTLAL
jgi:alpha-tubulin suppressor-like RCC1 family protein